MLTKHFQTIVVGSIFLTLLFGTFIAVQLSKRQQDLRQKASVPTGNVVVSLSPSSGPLVPNQDNEIVFSVNTSDVLIDGVQIDMDIVGQLNAAPTLQLIGSLGTSLLRSVTQTATGYHVTFTLVNVTDAGLDPLSSNTDVQFARLVINPAEQAQVQFLYNSALTYANVADSQPITDDLRDLPPNTYTALLATATATNTPIAQATETLTPTATICAMPTQPLCQSGETVTCSDNAPGSLVCMTCSCTPIATDPTATPTPTNTPQVTEEPSPTATLIAEVPTSTPLPTATPETGTGGTTMRYCGESCSSHADCAVNLMCYSGVCRLANNPTDAYCSNPPDQGIHRTCNEYCADSRECQTGLTCYYNRCRNPRNVSDSYCTEPVAYVARLSSTPRPRVVTATPFPTLFPTQQPAGGDTAKTISPTRSLPTNTPWPTYAPIATATPATTGQMTFADRIQSFVKGLLVVALAISAIFLLLWLLPIFFKRKRDDDDDDLPPTPLTGGGSSQYSDELHRKTTGDQF